MDTRDVDRMAGADGAAGEPRLPEGLQAALAELSCPPMASPQREALDEAVLSAVRGEFAARRRRRLAWSLAGPIAAAAGLALAVVLIRPFGAPAPSPRVAAAPHAAGDFNADGVVDILDAYALAKIVESPSTARAEHDVNADGAVDRLDVDALAAQVVRLVDNSGKGGA